MQGATYLPCRRVLDRAREVVFSPWNDCKPHEVIPTPEAITTPSPRENKAMIINPGHMVNRERCHPLATCSPATTTALPSQKNPYTYIIMLLADASSLLYGAQPQGVGGAFMYCIGWRVPGSTGALPRPRMYLASAPDSDCPIGLPHLLLITPLPPTSAQHKHNLPPRHIENCVLRTKPLRERSLGRTNCAPPRSRRRSKPWNSFDERCCFLLFRGCHRRALAPPSTTTCH